ncbi:MAG: tRNA-intron lyase [Nitrosopumilaceae archaeon]
MSEVEEKVEGILVRDQTLISSEEMQSILEKKGYGEISKKKFLLKPFESLYLLFVGNLELKKGNKKINFDKLLQECIKYDTDALTKFLIYRDLRSKGYTVKDGFGFGSDFRVYERGHFGEKGAKYLVFGFSEGKQEKLGQLQKKIEQITQMGKEPVLAVIERRGEVIYYKISRIKFLKNKINSSVSPIEL